MNRTVIAHELVKIARSLIASPTLDDLETAIGKRDWKYFAVFTGKRQAGNRPKNMGELKNIPTRAGLEQVIKTLVSIEEENEMLTFTFVGTKGRTDTYVLCMEPYDVAVPQAEGPKPKVIQLREGVIAKLEELGLHNLGHYQGKAGEQFSVDSGKARRIAVGNRDILLNNFVVVISSEDDVRRPDQRWGMYSAKLISEIDDKFLQDAVRWVKAGQTMIEVRNAAKEKWEAKKEIVYHRG